MAQLHETAARPERAFLVGVQPDGVDRPEAESLLRELKGLASSLGVEVAGELFANLRSRSAALMVGTGKADEIANAAKACEADSIIFDAPLAPKQQRNWEELSGLSVYDRAELIIRIFGSRALTAEASRLAGPGRRVPYALLRAAVFADPGQPGSTAPRILAQGTGLRFAEEDGRILVTPVSGGVTIPGGYSFQFERPGTLRIDTGGSCTVYFRPGSAGPAEGTFEFPLVVRSRLPGDRIAIRDGRKPLDELLAEWKVPREWREYVPVLEDRSGIVGILGSRAGARDRYRPGPASLDASVPRLAVEIEGIGPFRSIERSAEAP